MKLNPINFGIALAVTAAILWILCSLVVMAMPGPMMNMSGHMIHSDMNTMNWTLSFTGVFVGLVAWTVVAGIFGWLLAIIYNLLTKE